MELHSFVFMAGALASLIGTSVVVRAYPAKKKGMVNVGLYIMILGIYLELIACFLKSAAG